MKVIIATEQIFNSYGDLIGVKYHYEGGDHRKIKVFIPQGGLK